jgi:hypothetical protein
MKLQFRGQPNAKTFGTTVRTICCILRLSGEGASQPFFQQSYDFTPSALEEMHIQLGNLSPTELRKEVQHGNCSQDAFRNAWHKLRRGLVAFDRMSRVLAGGRGNLAAHLAG